MSKDSHLNRRHSNQLQKRCQLLWNWSPSEELCGRGCVAKQPSLSFWSCRPVAVVVEAPIKSRHCKKVKTLSVKVKRATKNLRSNEMDVHLIPTNERQTNLAQFQADYLFSASSLVLLLRVSELPSQVLQVFTQTLKNHPGTGKLLTRWRAYVENEHKAHNMQA